MVTAIAGLYDLFKKRKHAADTVRGTQQMFKHCAVRFVALPGAWAMLVMLKIVALLVSEVAARSKACVKHTDLAHYQAVIAFKDRSTYAQLYTARALRVKANV